MQYTSAHLKLPDVWFGLESLAETEFLQKQEKNLAQNISKAQCRMLETLFVATFWVNNTPILDVLFEYQRAVVPFCWAVRPVRSMSTLY